MLAILDSNEFTVAPHLKSQLEQALGVSITVTSLGKSSGDLFVQLDNGDSIIFERKQLPDDLTASISDGRLFEQAVSIPRVARFSFLMLCGELRYSERDRLMALRLGKGFVETGWLRESIEMALLRCQAEGMMVVTCSSYPDKVRRLVQWCSGIDCPHTSRRRVVQNPFAPDQDKIDFIAQLPGVGAERAANLIKIYPELCLNDLLIVACVPQEGVKVPGWGDVTYRNVRAFLFATDGKETKR